MREPFILIVYGATGFTGKLVSKYLDSHPELRGKPWAVAGRNQSKLADLAVELRSRPETICVDLEDNTEVIKMVLRASVAVSYTHLTLPTKRIV